ncbi:MAG: hypothetical protein O7B99_02710 [Planctomycetota bacterium]|nr:hypothetical protein [Planctomycetota bacterium]
MRLLAATALAGLAGSLFLPALAQDPTDDLDELPLLYGMRQADKARLEQEIVGAWLLTGFDSPREVIDQRDIQAFAVFHDGFLSLTIQARTFNPEFLGDDVQFWVQAGGHRYRISDFATLQTAAILGFHNANDRGELVFEPPSFPREYAITITDGAMTLERSDGTRFSFNRLKKSTFPNKAIDLLNLMNGSGGPREQPEDD